MNKLLIETNQQFYTLYVMFVCNVWVPKTMFFLFTCFESLSFSIPLDLKLQEFQRFLFLSSHQKNFFIFCPSLCREKKANKKRLLFLSICQKK